jgi:drug/metabolite transporter (DMT)-like permease
MFRLSPDRKSQLSMVGMLMLFSAFCACCYALATHPFPPVIRSLMETPPMLIGALLGVAGICLVHFTSNTSKN